jgi:hypothetical protein
MTALLEVPVTEEMKDFTRPKRAIKFKVDDDVFDAVPEIAAGLVVQFAEEAELIDKNDVKPGELIGVMTNLFQYVLPPESSTRLITRLTDPKNPIGLERVLEIIQWLLEQYGLRPTEADSDSSDGVLSPVDGTSSTVSA